ncbi:thymidylate kinase [Fusibacter paucivorans]|uniref:Thymidylate kinase n=1 Tax=Fusibacter paucivorans TaxID=76009 RepID=A0ABS5PSC4_9FIRM|nr:thymidylate kinase [Fusibacter paucivorans]MBS7526967.1 thymidylate kinase [Fusibacter paucivorans]
MSGQIFVVEGVDASGKESQTRALFERLKQEGHDVIRLSFPDYESESSSLVKMYLSGAFGDDPQDVTPYVASTFYAADRYASYMTKWRAHYERGGLIIADRYTTANMVHQASKIDDEAEKKIFLSWLWQLEYEIYKIPKPDIVFFLDMPPSMSEQLIMARQNKITGAQEKDIHEKDTSHLTKSHENAQFVSTLYNWDVISCIQDGQLRSIENINDELYEKAMAFLERDTR